MKDHDWRHVSGRLGHAHASRSCCGARLWVQRFSGSVKSGARLAWLWIAEKGDEHHPGAFVKTSGLAENETDARAAADAALPRVLRSFDALTSSATGGDDDTVKVPQLSPAACFLLAAVAMTTTKDVVSSWRASDGSCESTAAVLLDALGTSVSRDRDLMMVAEEVARSEYVKRNDRGEVLVVGLPNSMPTDGWREARDLIGLAPV